MYALVDASKTYTYNLEVYAGKQPEGPYCVSNKPIDVVKRLAEPLFGSGRNITADNWFTSCDLIDYLKIQKLSYVGTVRKNKRELPPQFVSVKERQQYSSMFAFHNGKALVSYVPHAKKIVLLLSTLHDDAAIDPGTGAEKKTEIITFYNATKGGVDTADQMCSTFNVSRNIKRWPMVIFFAMLNLGGINSQVIYLENKLEPLRRRLYLKKLAHELVLGELRRRSVKTIGIPSRLQVQLKRFRPEDDAYYRFVVLFFNCLLTFGSYFCFDIPSVLQDQFQGNLTCANGSSYGNSSCVEGLGMTPEQYNLLYAIYAWTNALVVILAGFLIDKLGNRFGLFLFSSLTVVGSSIFALGSHFKGSPYLLPLMLTGRLLFGSGNGSLTIVQNRITAFWFKGKELALAFGLTLSFSRLGSVLNFFLTRRFEDHFGIQWTLWGGTITVHPWLIICHYCQYSG
ncbi:unnamed protein product [Ranitomeya imitator]|uniref:Lysosomal dipeptide transporter MFSD1 n=1 Tax=Ranitomeya imitator TaxID=111125 RepID=A0ABN9M4E4_9NEOB|nr:unnamed protein product [Ranitomeya imitator]